MSIDKFLEDLAVESGLIEPEVQEVVTDTAADVIVEQQADEQPEALLEQAEKARDLADELEDLAEQADKIASADDEKYSAESIEFLAREYAVLTRVRGVKYKPYSFESEVNPQAKAIGISTDARRAAEHLRANAAVIDNLSNEGRIWDTLVLRDSRQAKAKAVLLRESSQLKSNATIKGAKPAIIKNTAVLNFLRNGDGAVDNLSTAMDTDVSYMEGVSKYIEERLSYLKGLTSTSVQKLGDEYLVNTFKSNGKFNKKDAKYIDYKLLGAHLVADFKVIGHSSSTADLTGVQTVKFIAGYMFFWPLGLVLATKYEEENKTLHVDGKLRDIKYSDVVDFAQAALKLDKYGNSKSTYATIKGLDGILNSIKSEKELYKFAKEELTKVIKSLEILKTRTFYLTTETARLIEQLNRAAK